MKRLNLGCGTDIRAGWINLDRSALPGVDVAHDLEQLPLPFPSESFDYVLCEDVLEHVTSPRYFTVRNLALLVAIGVLDFFL
jgi:predicted SAM-dependent methyltransferase